MTLTRWKFVVDLLLLVAILSLAITGLKPDIAYRLGNTGFQYLHIDVGKAFIALIIIHLGLNWRWITSRFSRRKSGE